MDLENIEGVRDLVLRYCDAINLQDLDLFADNFSESGIWEVNGHFKAEGRASVLAQVTKGIELFDWVFQVVQGTRVLSVDNEKAKARSYVAEWGNLRKEGYFFLATYHDECVKEDGVWRFAHRTGDILYQALPDLVTPLQGYTRAVMACPSPKRF